jgi:thiol-disulfide isomerase/thioredoxin
MRRSTAVLALVTALVGVGCQDNVWFPGDFEAAKATAEARGTLIMMDFYTDWCMWCRRLETDTFSDAAVRTELQGLVPLRLDAEGNGEELAARYQVSSFPTIVFTDSDGDEVERIAGFLPPDKFADEVRRIRSGDTFVAWLEKLEQDPGNPEALRRAVTGLLERSDPEGAIARIRVFYDAAGDSGLDLGEGLLLKARIELHQRHYALAAKLFHKGWTRQVEIDGVESGANLKALLEEGIGDLDPVEQARRLREARRADAARILEELADREDAVEDPLRVASFAYSSGLAREAASLYNRWYSSNRETADPGTLNGVAWNLYLAGESLDQALTMARQAYAADSSPSVADTLARLLYVTGSVNEAIAIQTEAAAQASGEEAAEYRTAVELMTAGEPLGDQPAFAVYPG